MLSMNRFYALLKARGFSVVLIPKRDHWKLAAMESERDLNTSVNERILVNDTKVTSGGVKMYYSDEINDSIRRQSDILLSSTVQCLENYLTTPCLNAAISVK